MSARVSDRLGQDAVDRLGQLGRRRTAGWRGRRSPRGPGSSTRQPMMPSVSGHNFSPAPLIVARPSPSVETTAAAAPSPNRAVATIAAGSSLSRRIEIEQVSTVTNSQRLPGSAAASRAAVARPVTPPAQPSPNKGTRRTSGRSPSRGRDAGVDAGRRNAGGRDEHHPVDLVRPQARAGDRLGRGVDEHRLGRRRRRARCARPSHAASRYQSIGATVWRWSISALSNTPDKPVEQRLAAAEHCLGRRFRF